MLRDVKHIVTDGLLGLSDNSGEGVHIKIGASPITSDSLISIKGSCTTKKIKEKLGLCPLADSVMDSCSVGASEILCLPVAASVQGKCSPISAVSACSCELSGTPYNMFHVKISVTGAGGFNEATFKYSIDGGNSWSENLTIPLTGEYEIAGTGTKLTFAAAENAAFAVGDSFEYKTTAPRMTSQDVITAVERLKHISSEAEFVHIVGEASAEMWAAVSVLQQGLMEEYHKAWFFLLEAYAPEKDEPIKDYTARLSSERSAVENYDIQVVAARGLYTGMDGLARETNLAGLVAGFYSKTKPHKSIGETAAISVAQSRLKLLPVGIEEYIEELDESGYLTFRQYDGLSGYYVTNAWMMSPAGSDFRYAEEVRIKNKIIRKTRLEALKQLQSDIDLTDVDHDLAVKAEFIKAPLDDMVTAGEISDAEVSIPSDQDIQGTGTMQMLIRYVPRGMIREILIDLGVKSAS